MTTPMAISPGAIEEWSDLVFLTELLADLLAELLSEDCCKTEEIPPLWLGVLGIIIVSSL
jgi:hypothetical protein